MAFTQQYNKLFISESSVSRTLILPKEIYKINSYKYVDGTTKSFTGIETALVFCIGVYDKKLVCVKITNINPTKFLNFLKNILKKGLKEEQFDKAETLSELCITSDKYGKTIFNTYLKNRQEILIAQNEPTYRTYNLVGIKSIEKLKFDPKVLKKAYGIKVKPENTKVETK